MKRVYVPNEVSVSGRKNTSSGRLEEETREPVVDAHQMGGIMAAKSVAAGWLVT